MPVRRSLERWPQGPDHILRQSRGGRHAYPIAAALRKRGGFIDMPMLAIHASGPSASISWRLGNSLLIHRTVRRIPAHAHQLLQHEQPRICCTADHHQHAAPPTCPEDRRDLLQSP